MVEAAVVGGASAAAIDREVVEGSRTVGPTKAVTMDDGEARTARRASLAALMVDEWSFLWIDKEYSGRDESKGCRYLIDWKVTNEL